MDEFMKLDSDMFKNGLDLGLSSKGEYLSYYDITNKYAKDANSIWEVLRLTRSFDKTVLPFKDTNGDRAAFNLTQLMNSIISQVDRMTTSAAISESLAGVIGHSLLLNGFDSLESISSSQLEGAATTTKVALDMLEVGREPTNESEMMIARNHNLMQKIPQEIDNDLSFELILELHFSATYGIDDEKYQPGKIRQTNDVVVVDAQDQVVHQPIDYDKIYDYLNQLCSWVNTPHHKQSGIDYIHPVIKACVLHFMIGWIHPFNDGNGRTARGLFYWYMMKMGFSGFRYISISKYMKRSATSYGTAYLNTEYDHFNLTYFIEYHLIQIRHAIEGFNDAINRQREIIAYLNGAYSKSEDHQSLNYRQRKIFMFGLLRGGETFSIPSIQARFNVAYNTAKTDLEILTKLRMFKVKTEGGKKLYITPKSIDQLEKWTQDSPTRTMPKATDW